MHYNLSQIWYAYLKKVSERQPFKLLCAFEMEVNFGSNATWMSEFLSETSVWDTLCSCYDKLTYMLPKLYIFVYYKE